MSKKHQYFAQKVDGEPMRDENPTAVEEFENNAAPGRYRKDYVKERAPKTQNQLGYIFAGIIGAIKEECNENRQDGVDTLLQYIIDEDIPKGQPATDDLIKDLCYTVAPTYDDNGRKRTLSGMDTGQAANFIDRIQRIFANFCEIPEPRESTITFNHRSIEQ